VSSRTARATQRNPVSKNQKSNKQTKKTKPNQPTKTKQKTELSRLGSDLEKLPEAMSIYGAVGTRTTFLSWV
jgi:ribosomal protein S4